MKLEVARIGPNEYGIYVEVENATAVVLPPEPGVGGLTVEGPQPDAVIVESWKRAGLCSPGGGNWHGVNYMESNGKLLSFVLIIQPKGE